MDDTITGTHVDSLLSALGRDDCYDYAFADVQEAQVAAMNERLQDRIGRIKVVAFRAKEAGITEIASLADAVPLLLPHTAYKSYPENFLFAGKWDKLTKWLGTVSPYPTDGVDLTGVTDVDGWVEACGKAGLFVSCSSGTTGKAAMLVASQADFDHICKDSVTAVQWGSDIRAGDMRTSAGPASAVAYTPRNVANGQAMMGAFVDPEAPRFQSGLPPVTIGSLTKMVLLRKAIAEGTARPEEIAAYEEEAKVRQEALDRAQEGAVDDIIAKRGERLYITGMWGALYPFAVKVRERGYSGKDFHPENAIYLGGGLKRAQLPADYREFVFETFNLQPNYIYQMYGMQELNTGFARCKEGGRYHVPPWVVILPLDKAGDALLDGVGKGQVEGRAAFFDLSLDGRWGGVISGDHVHIDYEPCACGAKSPSIRDDIYRYSDIEGDDKIGCAGTVDAYVRGMS
ncbi:hypothetical protein [Novosphingobium album (ex Hu et al. 2023)]|uniref:Acyl-protein synthetase LuxE domain-containing protein n=1 Tax=Novosphingobium album (ex Hu et al. 2023) TaxID=2930093 RepID=A0ABT0AYL4_9SPHN|nr:hypothetical protein [Novosphingobium album (ex Hu et al. 2023)]MCJ2177887.1 hypothetical protein [Novosphingobium album (ex Hu et al. 2023)]